MSFVRTFFSKRALGMVVFASVITAIVNATVFGWNRSTLATYLGGILGTGIALGAAVAYAERKRSDLDKSPTERT